MSSPTQSSRREANCWGLEPKPEPGPLSTRVMPCLIDLRWSGYTCPLLHALRLRSLRASEIGPLLLNDCRSDLVGGPTLTVSLTGQARLVDANDAGRGIEARGTSEQTPMSLALPIAITRLLCENVRDVLRDGISFADIRD